MKVKYAILAIDKNKDIVHFSGYENQPNQTDILSLKEELNSDPEFGLIGRIDKDVFLYPAGKDVVNFYNKMLGEKEL